MAEDLEFTLRKLADESRPVHTTNLAPLSDIPRSQADLFHAAWAGFGPGRRLELVRALVEQAENNIHLNFFAILRELLHDPDAEIRRLAIEGLWEDDRANLVSPLARLAVEDPEPAVRAAAATSLARFVLTGVLGEIESEPAEQAEETLRTVWHRQGEVTEVRRRALEGLAYIDLPDVRELIHNAYYDEDPLLGQSAIFAMGRSADRRWAKYVLAELESRDEAMRFEAAVAAGELNLAPAVRSLIRLLDDRDRTVREAAATALGQIGGPAAKRALEAAAGSGDEVLAEAAEAALEELRFAAGDVSRPLFDVAPARRGPSSGDATDSDGADDEEYDDGVFDYGEDDVDWLDEDEDGGDIEEDLEWFDDEESGEDDAEI